jgi:transposase
MPQPTHFIGIDLHKTVVQVCVLDDRGEISEEFRLRLERPEDGQEAIRRLTRWRTTGRFVVEAVGLNRWFVNGCRAAGLSITVADAAKLGLKHLGKKTDRRDAQELARRLFLGDIDRHATTYYPTDEEYGVRKVLRVRHHLVGMRQQVVNQLRALLNAYFVPAPSSVLYSGPSLRALARVELPTADLTLCLQTLVNALQSTQDLIDRLTRRMHQQAQTEAVQNLEERLPSVGPQTALTLRYELGELNRFQSAKQVCAYAGLVPRVANSGDLQHHGRLTKRGNPELRWIVGEWAVRLLAGHPSVQEWAKPRLRRMHKNKVRMVLARRLLVGLYISHTRGEPFSLTRCLAA